MVDSVGAVSELLSQPDNTSRPAVASTMPRTDLASANEGREAGVIMLTQQDDIGVNARGQGRPGASSREGGYALAVLLVSIAVMGILMSMAMPVWKTAIQREREEELIFRGEQYARAVGLFQRKAAGAFPPSVDLLVEQRFLRRKYKDPIVNGDFQVLYANSAAQPGQRPGIGTQPGTPQPGSVPGRPGADAAFPGPSQSAFGGSSTLAGPRGGMVGVVSKSTDKSFRLYKGRGRYNEWQFVYTAVATGAGVPGGPGRGGSPRPGQPAPGMPGQMGPGGNRPGSTPFPGRPPQGPIPQRPSLPQ